MAETLRLLAASNMAAAIAVVGVLLLRKPIRKGFGAAVAYTLWFIVPLAALAALLPARIVKVMVPASAPAAAPISILDLDTAATASAAERVFLDFFASNAGQSLVIAGWAIGVIASVSLVVWSQSRFVRGLGRTRDEGHIRRAEATAFGPAVVGALFPRIVLPSDFENRFSAAEQAAILAHEEEHLKAGHAGANGLIAAFQCLYWFNPLIHLAAFFHRMDQEMACDAQVLARRPKLRRLYAEALLKTQLGKRALPLGCYWPARSEHPLKARIVMLKAPIPSNSLRRSGVVLALVLAGAGAVATWEALPARVIYVQAPSAAASGTLAMRAASGRSGTIAAPLHRLLDAGVNLPDLVQAAGEVLDQLAQPDVPPAPLPAGPSLQSPAEAIALAAAAPGDAPVMVAPEPAAVEASALLPARLPASGSSVAQGPLGESSITLLSNRNSPALQSRAGAKDPGGPVVLRASNPIPAGQAVDIQGEIRSASDRSTAPLHMTLTPAVMKGVKDPSLQKMGVRAVGFGSQVDSDQIRLNSYVRTDDNTFRPHSVDLHSGETRTIVLEDGLTLTVTVTVRPQTDEERRADREASAIPAARQEIAQADVEPMNVPGFLSMDPKAEALSWNTEAMTPKGKVDLTCRVGDARNLEDCKLPTGVNASLADAAMTASFYLALPPEAVQPVGTTMKVPISF